MTDTPDDLVAQIEALLAMQNVTPRIPNLARELLAAAAFRIEALESRGRVLREALSNLLLRIDNKIALARDNNLTSYGHSYVLCAGVEACIEASKARAALAGDAG